MAFDFRYAALADIKDIVAIEQASMSSPWSENSYREAINSDHAFVLVATELGKVVAFAVFYLTTPEAELPDIVVAETYRGKGLGRQLLDYSLSELKTNGVDTLFLEVRESNTAARGLYTDVGFEEIGKRKYFYSNPTEDAICMRLELS